MFIGRWQNWHAGHEWLIRQQLDKGKNVWVAIRDVAEDEKNPKSAYKVMMDLMEEPFFIENIDRILVSIIPDIESVNYGNIVEIYVHTNSTRQREQFKVEGYEAPEVGFFDMDTNGDIIIYSTNNDSTTQETHS